MSAADAVFKGLKNIVSLQNASLLSNIFIKMQLKFSASTIYTNAIYYTPVLSKCTVGLS